MIRRAPIALFAAWFGAVGATAAGGVPGAAPPGYVSERLPNGLLVSIWPDPAHTVVATQMWYHVGSANEEPSNRGFAHLFEHLMFGATATYDKADYSNYHHRRGGDENAYTSFDETVYVSTIAAEHHDQVLVFEADRMTHLVLDEENLANEKRIVTEELRMRTENDPFSRVGVAALEAVLGEHPYAHTPVGTVDDIAAATIEQCRRFYTSYYRPRNAHLIIVGPVDARAKLAEVRRLFEPLPAEGVTPLDVPALDTWDLADSVELEEDLPPAEIAILAYTLPPADAAEYWTLQVMLQLLAGGAVDPFEHSLVARRQKAVYASTDSMEMRRGGALMFSAAFLPYRRKTTAFRLMDETRDELARLHWLTEDSLASAKRTLRRRELGRTYWPESRAEAIGQAQWWHGDEQVAFDAAARIETVTRDDVARAFETWVVAGEPVRVYLRPKQVPLLVRLFGWVYPLVQG